MADFTACWTASSDSSKCSTSRCNSPRRVPLSSGPSEISEITTSKISFLNSSRISSVIWEVPPLCNLAAPPPVDSVGQQHDQLGADNQPQQYNHPHHPHPTCPHPVSPSALVGE